MSDTKKNIGLFGGTFNPVHFGHLRPVLEVVEGFPLDECYHKAAGDMIAAGTRLEMTRLAVSGHPGLNVSDVELKRSGPSYTVDTVRHFKAQLPGDTRLFLIVLLAALGACAAVGILVFLFGEFNETEWRILATCGTVAFTSLQGIFKHK